MASRMLVLSLLSASLPAVFGFCPAGFGPNSAHPKEWKIPKWPTTMSEDKAGKLRTVTMGGFQKKALNEEYLEGPTKKFKVQGQETYWQASGDYFMYWCSQHRKWRVANIQAFGEIAGGQCYSFCSDGFPGRHIRNQSLIKGWIEVVDGKWEIMEHAGVFRLGTLQEQILLSNQAEEECEDDDGEPGFGEKKKVSKCPVTRTYNAMKDGLTSIGKWAKRLFPKLLSFVGGEELEQSSAEEGGKKKKVKTELDKWKSVEKGLTGGKESDDAPEETDGAQEKNADDQEKKAEEL